jgi:hypothetical protein
MPFKSSLGMKINVFVDLSSPTLPVAIPKPPPQVGQVNIMA